MGSVPMELHAGGSLSKCWKANFLNAASVPTFLTRHGGVPVPHSRWQCMKVLCPFFSFFFQDVSEGGHCERGEGSEVLRNSLL